MTVDLAWMLVSALGVAAQADKIMGSERTVATDSNPFSLMEVNTLVICKTVVGIYDFQRFQLRIIFPG
ncbi:MAG: hypothetical protein AAFY20_21000 [Cyanobacteria bacterium J06639_14]